MTRRRAATQEERVERQRRSRLAGNAAKRAAPRVQREGPVVIPSEARMLENLERAWGDAIPGVTGPRAVERPRHPDT